LDKSFRIRKKSQITIAKGTGPVAMADLSGEKSLPMLATVDVTLGRKGIRPEGG
jgi:hypothetical protein